MEQIRKVLQITKQEYELLKYSLFLTWSDEHSSNSNHLQAILNTNKVFQWFSQEYAKKEASFLQDIRAYGNISAEQAKQLYGKYTSHIEYYPSALLKQSYKKVHIPKSNFITYMAN